MADASVDSAAKSEESSEKQDFRTLLQTATDVKLDGNKDYKKGLMFAKHTAGKNLLMDACKKYADALQLLFDIKETIDKEPEEHQKLLEEQLLSVYLNLAASGLKLDSFDTAINSCNAALDLDENNCKAIFRRGQAYLKKLEYDLAKADFVRAAKLQPKNKDIRAELKQCKLEYEKHLKAVAFKEETEKGMEKLRLKQQATENTQAAASISSVQIEEFTDNDEDIKESSQEPQPVAVTEAVEEDVDFLSILKHQNLEGYLTNGGKNTSPEYYFGQTLTDIHLFIQVPKTCKAKQITCSFHRSYINLIVKDDSGIESVIFDKLKTTKLITVDECLWEFETDGVLHLYIHKEPIPDGEQGHEWWASVFKGHDQIDVAECNVGTLVRDLPEKQKKLWEKSMYEESQKTPDEKQQDEQLRKAQAEIDTAEERRLKSEEIAMNDPGKKALFNMFKDKFPDIPVEFR